MTYFVKEDFQWDGMYLTYKGDFEGAKLMQDVHPNCHVGWYGKLKPAFIARFKHGYKPWKSWINFLVKNVHVEEYMYLSDHNNKFFDEDYGYEVGGSPVFAMETLGYKGKT